MKLLLEHYFPRIFPPEVALPFEVKALIEHVFPTIPWKLVKFHKGIPWHSYSPMALAGTYSYSSLHIYLRDYQFSTPAKLSHLIHECYHVQQYHQLGAKGFGFFRPCMVTYLSYWMRYGYRKHPMEVQAYQTDALYRSCFEKVYAQCPKFPLDIPLEILKNQALSPILKSPKLPKLSLIFWIFGFFLTLFAAVLKPAVEIILWIVLRPFKHFKS